MLHIDDDEEDHEIFASALLEANPDVEVVFADNAREALETLENTENHPDLIFLDLNMPGMTGQEFLLAIKKHPQLKNIPVNILSTSSHKPTIELVKEHGAKEFITKPDNYQDMVNILKKELN